MTRVRLFVPLMVATAVLLGLAPSRAGAAQGLALAWNHCFGEPGWAANAAFACDANAGSNTIVGSFRLASPMNIVIGTEIVIDLATASPSLPPWWQFKYVGSCRLSSLTAPFVHDAADVGCPDWSGGLLVGGLGGYCTAFNGPPSSCGVSGQLANTARIKAISAVAPNERQDLLGDQNYFAFSLQIDHVKTVGAGACGGCNTPVCIVLNSINVVAQGNVEMRFITQPATPGSNFITWQGGGTPVGGGGIGCPAATPTQRSTWGSVKSLYR